MRTIQQRKADVLAALERNGDLWLATASRSGRHHLVALARLAESMPVNVAAESLQAGFAAAVGWSPMEEPGDRRFLRLAPTRIQAYRGYGELEGRDVFNDGRWLA